MLNAVCTYSTLRDDLLTEVVVINVTLSLTVILSRFPHHMNQLLAQLNLSGEIDCSYKHCPSGMEITHLLCSGYFL